MLPNKSFLQRGLALGLWLVLVPSYALEINSGDLSAQSMLININEQMPYLMRMVTAISYVMGMFFIFYGIVKMKHFGESRTMMSQEHSAIGPIVLLVIGALLIYIPTSVEVGLSTFWSSPNPYGYVEQQPDQWGDFYKVCYSIIQFIGVIAFIRGLITLSHLHANHSQQGTFGKGVTYVIAGIFCINIYQFVQTILGTLGISVT